MEQIPKPPAPYYVEGRAYKPCATWAEARIYAGIVQHSGVRRSLQIFQNGQVVDIKRY